MSIPGVNLYKQDCLAYMRTLPDNYFDLTFGSPPYEDARQYGINFKLKGQDWVDWMVERMVEMVRVTKGLVAMVVEGTTNKYRWSAAPVMLMADLHRAGVCLRKPPLYVRHGIPGSGGPDWWKNRYEFIICCTSGGRLPWSDNTATGKPPKCGPGGSPSHRDASGKRATEFTYQTRRRKDGSRLKRKPSTRRRRGSGKIEAMTYGQSTERDRDGKLQPSDYRPPEKANPGNIIDCGADTHFGLGNENEAPFPKKLVRPFVLCFCPPDGTVYDPFCGSGTTGVVAVRYGGKFIGTDIRASQIKLATQRITNSYQTKGFGL